MNDNPEGKLYRVHINVTTLAWASHPHFAITNAVSSRDIDYELEQGAYAEKIDSVEDIPDGWESQSVVHGTRDMTLAEALEEMGRRKSREPIDGQEFLFPDKEEEVLDGSEHASKA